ncbi:hypothetical protein D9619_003860 [Psilocybe cf. subviscida]|uniref:Aldehyde dehydrogenase n=1 Tax=Psilocybe cf. subviscida TaxID=2480587 RepID=A0A8H5AWA8_9AGAR|nr:hypothetical protein D9619_003860 [Psilocybe cf. subviscida]
MSNYTPIDQIPEIHASLRKAFRSGVTRPLEWRRHQLHQLARFVQENTDALAHCLYLDLGKPRQEAVMGDIGPIVDRSLICAKNLEEWVGETSVKVQDWQQGWNPRVRKEPKGVILIISPWNYPVVLSLQPLYGAIGAGCCALIKVSEVAPHYATFLHDNLGKYLDPNCFKVALGEVPEITKILELKWDHIFYTGNGRIARVISHAAAEHLTPLTLELGGKSPVILDASADVSLAAKRILWGKLNNAGQICVAPDFVLAPKAIIPKFVEELKRWHAEFYGGKNGDLEGDKFGKIVSEPHFKRLRGLLARTKGKVVMGGEVDEAKRKMQLTVVTDVKQDDALLEGEIFGPIIPIMAVENVQEAIDYINSRDHPLVLYAFATDESVKKQIVDQTTSGGVAFNDTFGQMAMDEVPFGGVGESGYGRQVLKYSIDNFVYERGVADVPYAEEPHMGLRYPPYTKESLAAMSGFLSMKIPSA